MFRRSCHYWLCCLDYDVDKILAQLNGIPARVAKGPRPTGKFGPYDYVYIDASEHDAPIDLLLGMLLDRLEAIGEGFLGWGDEMTNGISITVRSNDPRYAETIFPDTFLRAARLKLPIGFTWERPAPEPAHLIGI